MAKPPGKGEWVEIISSRHNTGPGIDGRTAAMYQALDDANTDILMLQHSGKRFV